MVNCQKFNFSMGWRPPLPRELVVRGGGLGQQQQQPGSGAFALNAVIALAIGVARWVKSPV